MEDFRKLSLKNLLFKSWMG